MSVAHPSRSEKVMFSLMTSFFTFALIYMLAFELPLCRVEGRKVKGKEAGM